MGKTIAVTDLGTALLFVCRLTAERTSLLARKKGVTTGGVRTHAMLILVADGNPIHVQYDCSIFLASLAWRRSAHIFRGPTGLAGHHLQWAAQLLRPHES